MAEIASAWVSLVPSARGFGAKMTSQVGGEVDKAGKTLGSRLGNAMKIGFAAGGFALAAFGKSIVSASSEAQQSIGATETVFGKFADAVIKTSNKAAQAYGLSAHEYRENANLIGSLFKNQGVELDKLGVSTEKMIARSADLAATFGGSTKDAVDALGAAFKGEFNQVERYGISLRQSTINMEAFRIAGVKTETGFNKLSTATQNAAKRQATTNLIFEQSKDSLGAFGKEANTLAGQQQRLAAQFENIKATLGNALLPVLTRLAAFVNSTILPAVSKFIKQMQNGRGAGGDFADAMTRVGAAVRDAAVFIRENLAVVARLAVAVVAVKAALVTWAVAQATVNGAMAAGAAVLATYNAVLALSNSYLAVWIGVKGIEAAAWLRSTAATAASTVAMAANRVAYGTAWVATFIAIKGAELAAWLRSTAAAVASTAAMVVHKVAMVATTVATKAWAAAQWALNAAMLANPVGLVLVAVAALVAGLIIAYKKSETFRNAVDTAWAALKTFAGVLSGIVSAAIRVVISFVGDLIGRMVEVGKAIRERVQDAAEFAQGIKQKFGEAVNFVQSIPGKITAALGNLGSLLYNAGISVLAGFVEGIRSKIDDLQGVLSGITDKIPDWKGPADKDAVLLRPAGQMIMKGLVDGIEDGTAALREKLQGITEEIKSRIDSIKSDMASLAGSVASAFTGNLFEATDTQGFLGNLLDTKGQLKQLKAAFKRLVKWGLSPQFLSQMFASGNGALILDMAASGNRGFALEAAQTFGQVNSLANSLGGQVARNEYGKKLDRANDHLAEIRRDIKNLPKNIGKELNTVGGNAARSR